MQGQQESVDTHTEFVKLVLAGVVDMMLDPRKEAGIPDRMEGGEDVKSLARHKGGKRKR